MGYAMIDLIIDMHFVMKKMIERIAKERGQGSKDNLLYVNIPIILDGPLVSKILPFIRRYFGMYLSNDYQVKEVNISIFEDSVESIDEAESVKDKIKLSKLIKKDVKISLHIENVIMASELKRRKLVFKREEIDTIENRSKILQQAVLAGKGTTAFQNFESL